MKYLTAKSFILTAVVLNAAVAQAHVEKGSFLNKRAVTVNQLVYQVEHDHQVLDRYERHFQMSESELVTYFEGLHVGKLETTGSYVVYNCHDDEVIRARVFHLRKGTPMFVDANDQAVLKISCGNPMIAPKPHVVINIQPKPRPHEHEVAPPAPAPVIEKVIVETPPPPPAPAPQAPTIIKEEGGSVVNNTTTNNNKSYSSLFFLPVLLIFNNHSGGGHEHKQPVPEPTSLLIMGFGATAMLIRKRKKAQV